VPFTTNDAGGKVYAIPLLRGADAHVYALAGFTMANPSQLVRFQSGPGDRNQTSHLLKNPIMRKAAARETLFHVTTVAMLTVVALGSIRAEEASSDALNDCIDYSEETCDGAPSCDDAYASSFRQQSLREQWADNGITFTNNLTQFYFGTVSGGAEQTSRYGGHGDYVTNVDFGKLGIQEGLFLKIRAEHQFGESIVESTGALLPATIATELPTPQSRDLYLTNFVITQALSEEFILFAGKVDSLDGDRNAFAHGRGITQFSNLGFVANPVALRTIPYASLGAGFAVLRDGQPLFSFLVVNPTDTATSSGFDELFNEGAAISMETRVPTRFFGRPGHYLLGGTYSTRDYVSLGQDPRIVLPEIPVARSTDSWSVYWNSDHYLCVDPCDETRGWGYFSRAGVGDDGTNPVSYFWSGGLGGSSNLPGRDRDSFGVGYYYLETSDEIGPLLTAALGRIGDGQGIETFYNIQATRALTITPDFQWIASSRQIIDDAYVLGVRANIAF
jgi:porin